MSSSTTPKEVVVHPLVLLSVVDHYNRVAKGTKKRVVGILLGENSGGRLDVTNSFAVPYEDDPKDASVFFFDVDYARTMVRMQRKISAKEVVLGFYSTGPEIRPCDLELCEMVRAFTPEPVLTVIDVNPKDDVEIPTRAFLSVEENLKHAKSTSATRRTFVHLPTEVDAFEAEEVGVEHLLRDIDQGSGSTATEEIRAKFASLRGLKKRMEMIAEYLTNVVEGKMRINHKIVYNLQDMFNLAPNITVESLVAAFQVQTNDNMHVVYMSAMIRSIVALHDLINNKMMNLEVEADAREAELAAKKKRSDEKKKKQEELEKKNKEKAEDAASSGKKQQQE